MNATGMEWGSGRAVIAADQGIVLARFGGVLLAESARDAVREVASYAERARAHASLMDYSGAGYAFRLSVLSRHVRSVAHISGGLVAPAAYIVRADELPIWRSYAQHLCGAGLLRAAFSDERQARAWAADMAALYAAQASFRAP